MAIETSRLNGWGITLLRVVTGVVFIAHGWQKLFVWGFDGVAQAFGQMGIPFAGATAVLVTLLELFGGIALVAGLFTRLVSLPLAVTMLVAMLQVHLSGGFFMPNGIEFTLILFAATAGLALTGAGELALDNVLARRRVGGAAYAAPRAVAAS